MGSVDPFTPLTIASTVIRGNHHTRSETIEAHLQAAYGATTLKGVADELLKAQQTLSEMDIFDSVEFDLGPYAPAESELVVTVKEKRLLSFKATTFVEQGEGGVEVSGKLRNVLGRGEYCQANFCKGGSELGAPRKTSLGVELTQPFLLGLPVTLSCVGDHSSHRPQGASPYEQFSTGGALSLQLLHKNQVKLEYSARLRDVMPDRDPKDPGQYACPPELLGLARPSLKCALSVFATGSGPAGVSWKARGEWADSAVLGGDVDHRKLSVAAHRSVVLLPGLRLALGLELAHMHSPRTATLPDRLFLGGPLHLRGFAPRGVGARSADGTAALGSQRGSVQGKVALEADAPRGLPVKAHVFCCAGALIDEPVRMACGGGLVLPLGPAVLEVNLVRTLVHHKGDAVSGRWQFGLGADFL